MASTAQYSCKSCQGIFTARTADRKRGWALFCSKSCKATRQEKKTHQFAAFKERSAYRDDDDFDFVGHPFDSGYFGHGQE